MGPFWLFTPGLLKGCMHVLLCTDHQGLWVLGQRRSLWKGSPLCQFASQPAQPASAARWRVEEMRCSRVVLNIMHIVRANEASDELEVLCNRDTMFRACPVWWFCFRQSGSKKKKYARVGKYYVAGWMVPSRLKSTPKRWLGTVKRRAPSTR